jgi:PTS system nitrogen regulatory IIA component
MQVDVKEAARLLAISEKTVYRWIRQGTLPAYKMNDQYRFNRSELLEAARGMPS